MQQPRQLDDNTIKAHSKTIWLGLLFSSVALAIAIFFLDSLGKIDPFMPKYKSIFIGLCVLSVPLCFLSLPKYRKSELTIRNNIHSGIENNQPVLLQYMQWMVVGMFLCDLPAMFGVVLYMACGDLLLSLFFIFVSFICGFFYKPEL